MSLKGKTFQSFICFEVLDDDHVRAGAKDMDFLIAQTNNATFVKVLKQHSNFKSLELELLN